ncbi:hypothetical protein C4D60_Mb08t27120 [Musa balbisiana]|uniref:DUF7876 domain-containing protein n=1 Tax=Musa balbisiana TaxID=52838 RepID=A0A4S8K6U2_MUSBA|nr:hypothetical protein C4D60_Mb08t27120 [Musa balbisiana]
MRDPGGSYDLLLPDSIESESPSEGGPSAPLRLSLRSPLPSPLVSCGCGETRGDPSFLLLLLLLWPLCEAIALAYDRAMLTVHHAGAIQNFWIDGERKTYMPACSDSSRHAYNMKGFLAFRHCLERPCIQNLWMSPNLKSHYSRIRNHHLWRTSKDGIRKNWLCHWDSNASSDHDYRSSRNIAISLLKRYRIVIDRGGGDNLKEFISAGVNAYALGCTDEGLRKELIRMKDSGSEIEGLQSHSGGTTLKSMSAFMVEHCIYHDPVHATTHSCQVVIYAASHRLPVKTLQLEQMAVMGSSEEPSVVASRMRLVFSTLEENKTREKRSLGV